MLSDGNKVHEVIVVLIWENAIQCIGSNEKKPKAPALSKVCTVCPRVEISGGW